MFCKNCGNPVGEGEKFCVKCGTRVAPEVAPASAAAPAEPEVTTEAAAPVEAVAPEAPQVQVPVMEKPATPANTESANVSFAAVEEPVKKKRKWKKKAIVAGIVAASLTVTSTLAALIVPEVGNFMAKTFMSSEKYFAHVQKNNAETIAADVASLVGLLDGKAFPTNISGSTSAEVEFGEGLKELLRAEGGEEAAAMLGWIERLGWQMDVKMNGAVYGVDGAVRVNGSDFVNVNSVLDMERGYAYLSVPQLNSQAIRMSTGLTVSSEEFQQIQAFLQRIAEIVPEEKVLEDMLKRYISAIAEQVKDVNEKSETIKAGGVSQKATCMEVKITQKLIFNATKAVLKEARSDKDLKAIFKKVGALAEEMGESVNVDSMWDEMVEAIDETLDDMEDVDVSNEKLGTLKFWVNSKGEVIGVGFKAEGAEVKGYTVEKGDKYGVSFIVDAPGQSIEFDGSGTISGGKRSGTFALSVQNNEIVKVTLSDVDDTKLKEQGLFSGKITIEPSASISGLAGMAGGDVAKYLQGAKIELIADSVSDYEGSMELGVHLAGKHFATLKVNAKAQEGGGSVAIPSSYVNADRGSDMERWTEGVNVEGLIGSLQNAGAPSEMIQAIEGEMNPTAEEEVGTGAVLEDTMLSMPTQMPSSIRIPYNATVR